MLFLPRFTNDVIRGAEKKESDNHRLGDARHTIESEEVHSGCTLLPLQLRDAFRFMLLEDCSRKSPGPSMALFFDVFSLETVQLYIGRFSDAPWCQWRPFFKMATVFSVYTDFRHLDCTCPYCNAISLLQSIQRPFVWCISLLYALHIRGAWSCNRHSGGFHFIFYFILFVYSIRRSYATGKR